MAQQVKSYFLSSLIVLIAIILLSTHEQGTFRVKSTDIIQASAFIEEGREIPLRRSTTEQEMTSIMHDRSLAESKRLRSDHFSKDRIPYLFSDGDAIIKVVSELTVTSYSPRIYDIKVDTSLCKLTVNGAVVVSAPPSDNLFLEYASIDLSPYLTIGVNTVEAIVYNEENTGALFIRPSLRDPLRLAYFIFLCVVLSVEALLITQSSAYPLSQPLTISLTVAVSYITYCSLQGDIESYSYDLGGHLEYLDYIRTYLQIPPFNQGWQYYQPPLYYVAAFLWDAICSWCGTNEAHYHIKNFALLCIVISAAVMHKMARLLEQKKFLSPSGALLLAPSVCLMPCAVMMSMRVSNDVLNLMLVSITLYVALLVYSTGGRILALVSLCGLGMLTKSSAMLCIPLAIYVIGRTQHLTRQQKIISSLLLFVITGITAITLAYVRFQQGQQAIIGNLSYNSPELFISATWDTVTNFDIEDLLTNPFTRCCSRELRTDRIWEVLFRSLYFGIFHLSPKDALSSYQGVIFIGLIMLCFSFTGALHIIRKAQPLHWIYLFCAAGSLAAVAVMRLNSSHIGVSEARFIPLLPIGLLFLAVYATEQAPRWLATIMRLTMVIHLFACCWTLHTMIR